MPRVWTVRRVCGLTCVLSCVVLWSSLAWGWADAGHKIVASIAFRRLTPEERTRVVALLKQHPRFGDDFTNEMPEEVRTGDQAMRDEWVFQQAAVWPDIARGFEGETRELYHHPTWHYINLPHFLVEADRTALTPRLTVNTKTQPPSGPIEEMNIIQTIRVSRKLLTTRDTEAAKKGIHLAWIFHTVGDIHQPLHSTAMFSRGLFPEGDRGGNSVPTVQRDNLHSVWDGFPGGKVRFATARNAAIEYVAAPEQRQIGDAAARLLDEEAWLKESHALAREFGYTDEVVGFLRALEPQPAQLEKESLKLSEEYLKTGGRIAQRRVVEAGYRLGAILKEIVRE